MITKPAEFTAKCAKYRKESLRAPLRHGVNSAKQTLTLKRTEKKCRRGHRDVRFSPRFQAVRIWSLHCPPRRIKRRSFFISSTNTAEGRFSSCLTRSEQLRCSLEMKFRATEIDRLFISTEPSC